MHLDNFINNAKQTQHKQQNNKTKTTNNKTNKNESEETNMATLIPGVGARAGMQMKAPRGFMEPLSKAADPGSSYRLFIPTTVIDVDGQKINDLLVGFGAGRDLDFKVFDTTFMTYKKEWYTDEGNGAKCLIGVDSYAKVSRAILEAMCNSEKEKVKAEAKQLAEANGGQQDDVALFRKLDKIDEKYHGRDAEEGVQRTYAQVSPMVKGLQYLMVMEMLLVPMDSTTNTPLWDKAKSVYKKCNNTFTQKIIQILDKPEYFKPEKGYLEIAFTYGTAGQAKKDAGQAASYAGVAESLSLEVAFPDLWNKVGAAKVKDIAGGKRDLAEANEIILTRTGFRPGNFTAQDLRSKMMKWVSNNTVILTHLDLNHDNTKRAAKDMINLGIVDSIANVKSKLMEIVESQGDEDDVAQETTTATSNPTATSTEPVQAINEAVLSMQESSEVNPIVAQAQEMVTSGAEITARVGSNLPLVDDDDEDLGELL